MVWDVNARCTGVISITLAIAAAGAAEVKAGLVVLPIAFHVAQIEGRAVVEPSFIDQRVAAANRIFAPYGVAFEQTTTLVLDGRHGQLESREDRDALGA